MLQALDATETLSLTEKLFLDIQKRNNEGQAGGAGGSTTIEGVCTSSNCSRDCNPMLYINLLSKAFF